jgi:3'-5' exoribonuclease
VFENTPLATSPKGDKKMPESFVPKSVNSANPGAAKPKQGSDMAEIIVSCISAIPVGESLTGFALVLAKDEHLTREGAPYLSLLLGDKHGHVTAKIWDLNSRDVNDIELYGLVKVRGVMGEWQGKKQLRIQKIRPAHFPGDAVAVEDFVAAAPEKGEDMMAYVCEIVEKVEHPHIRVLLQTILKERGERLLIAPAASRNHHAVRGGLLYHIKTMLRAGLSLLPVYPFLNKDLLVAGIILHDMAKLEELAISPLGVASEYTTEGNLLGHLVMGVKDIDRISREVGMEKETALLLEHMVLSHHYEPEFGSPKRPAFPEAELLHFLDILDARLYDMDQIITDTPHGSFSEKVWRLDNRRLYRSAQEPLSSPETTPLG